MTAKNDVTNDLIKSRAYSKQGRKTYDKAFAKRTFNEWTRIEGGPLIFDPSDKKITYTEFKNRLKLDGHREE
jgi:hypothetical protein